jgi:hypothetical protein
MTWERESQSTKDKLTPGSFLHHKSYVVWPWVELRPTTLLGKNV